MLDLQARNACELSVVPSFACKVCNFCIQMWVWFSIKSMRGKQGGRKGVVGVGAQMRWWLFNYYQYEISPLLNYGTFIYHKLQFYFFSLHCFTAIWNTTSNNTLQILYKYFVLHFFLLIHPPGLSSSFPVIHHFLSVSCCSPFLCNNPSITLPASISPNIFLISPHPHTSHLLL